MRQLVSAAAAVLVDSVLGEPPLSPHPVSVFGRAARAVEARVYRDSWAAGALHAGVGVTLGVAAGTAVRSTLAATYLAVAGRSLREAAAGVHAALDAGDVELARSLLPALVGRSTDDLDAKEIVRAAVESVAENTVDAIVAPALWGAAAGAPGALGYRAINTMDAMIGHRSPRYARYGTAAARLDDVANWVPARVTAALVATARPTRARAVWSAVRQQAPAHPSPNAGVAEAAFAAALDLRLGGVNRYGTRVELRPCLGYGRPPEPADIGAALRLSRDVGVALATALSVVAVVRR
ncbi:MAG: adenosylcobinamide-phosphate synthase CbiB [Acidimicrobiales bacterium]